MSEFQPILEKWKKKLWNDKSSKIIFVIGIVLILLVYFWTDFHKNDTTSTSSEQIDYALQMEQRIGEIVENIAGAPANVMVTLESDGETVYADQVDVTTDTTEDTGSESVKVQKSDDTKHSYIIVENADGTQQALVVSKIHPRIKGVAIVVPNISEQTKKDISDAVTTALDISSSKVCVISS